MNEDEMRTTTWISLLTLAGVAACSTGGEGPGQVDEPPGQVDEPPGQVDDSRSYAELQSEYGALYREVTQTLTVTDPSQLPTSGTARYDGVMQVGVHGGGSNFQALGDAEVLISFDGSTNPISGGATNFRASGDQVVSGSLGFSNGAIDRSAGSSWFSLFFDVAGTLTYDGVDYDLLASTLGDFRGQGPADPSYLATFGYGTSNSVFGADDFTTHLIARR